MTRTQTVKISFRAATLVLLGLGVLTAYYWFLPLGIILEMAFWVHFVNWD